MFTDKLVVLKSASFTTNFSSEFYDGFFEGTVGDLTKCKIQNGRSLVFRGGIFRQLQISHYRKQTEGSIVADYDTPIGLSED